MPYENSDDAERHSDSEERERTEDPEREESPEDFEKEAREAADDLERGEAADRMANDASDELDEMESKSKEVEDYADDDTGEPDDFERETEVDKEQSMEDELGHDLDEVRDELHDKYVNNMERQLEEPSTKDVEGDETGEDGTSSEMTESNESYEDAGDGMAYAMETKGETEGHAQSEVENETEQETQESTESSEPVDETEESYEDKTTNRITKPEHGEEDSEEIEPRTTTSTQESEARSLSKTESDENLEEPDSEPSVDGSHGQEESEVAETEEPESEVRESTTEEERASEVDELHTEEQPESPDFETESSEVSESEETSEYQQQLTEYQDDLHEVTEYEEETVESDISENEVSELEDQESPVETDESVVHETVDEATEDFIDRVEELLERFETPNEDSDEQFVVEALTGEKVRDRTLEPRSFFGESEEDEVEEEEVRARLRELFGELTEEERERFKEMVRARLKNDEDLDALIKRHPSLKLSSDFRQKLKEARAYVKDKRQGSVPKLIRESWVLEVEREWSNAVGEAVRKSIERIIVSERKAESVRIKQARKKKRKTGYHKKTERLVKLHRPMTGKQPVASFERYRAWLEQNYPAVCERSDYPKLLDSVRKFFELRKSLKRRQTIKQHELEELARHIGIPPATAIDWALYRQSPHLFQIVDSAFSKREGLRLRTALFRKIDGIQDWSELERRLKQVYPESAYKKISEYTSKRSRVKEFFAVLGYLEKGGTRKGIAKQSGISQRRVRAFFDGEVPWLLRHVLAKTGKLTPSKRYSHHRSSTFKVKIRSIKLRGKVIGSYSEFKKIVDRDFPWLKERADYERLLHVVRVYFLARRKFGNLKHVTRNEIVDFAERHDISHQTVSNWLAGRSLPMVIGMLESALSVTEAKTELKTILEKLNGVVSLSEYKKRMRSFYLLRELKALPNYKKDYELVKEFFRFLKALEKGGLYPDIIERGGLNYGTTKRRRLYYKFPRLIGIAASQPEISPRRGHRWNPLLIDKHGIPGKYVEVPLAINKVSDLTRVLEKLVPLIGKEMKSWTKRFGTIPKIIAFMYLLGALVSDGSFGRRNGISTRSSISLSTKYSWSETFGEAFCYCLGLFGFKAGRIKNSISKNKAGKDIEKMNWTGSASPFLLWIRNTLLGLKMNTSKQDQPILADWILKMPRELIVSFLQGVADGDGFASVRSLNAGIGTKHNKEFFKLLLSVFGIDSLDAGTGIIITRKKSLKIAAYLPLFKYADGRLFRLRELNQMRDSMKYTKVSSEEQARILEHHRHGIKTNQIGPLLWDEFGKARRSNTIQKVINDSGQ